MENNNITSFWGDKILDKGFMVMPNFILHNYRKIGMTHAEYCLIQIILSFKHNTSDPYPSQETIAKIYFGDDYTPGSSERAVRKLINSLKNKGLLRTGQRINKGSRKFSSSVYSFKPLIDKCLSMLGDNHTYNEPKEYEILWDDETDTTLKVPTDTTLKVPTDTTLKVPTDTTLKVPTNNTIINNTNKNKEEEEEENQIIELAEIFQNNISTINDVVKAKIKKWLNVLPFEVIKAEIENASLHGAKSWAYIEKALQEDVKMNISNVVDFDNKLKNHKNRNNRKGNKKPIRTEYIPSYMQENDYVEPPKNVIGKEEAVLKAKSLQARMEKYKKQN